MLAKAHALGFTIAHPTCKESFCQKTRMKLRNNVGWRTRDTNSKQWGLLCGIRPDLVDGICNPPAQEAETGLMQHRGQLVYRVRPCLKGRMARRIKADCLGLIHRTYVVEETTPKMQDVAHVHIYIYVDIKQTQYM